MSRISRLLPSFAAGRRTYSFFSSKPGGGRYFNSAKPPKVVSPPAANASKAPVDQSNPIPEPVDGNEELPPHVSQMTPPAPEERPFPLSSVGTSPHVPLHPMVKPHEFKLHHFFSLHRPLLLLHQPTATLFESQSSTPAHSSPATIDDPPEASPEADADAARQLSRALVMNRVGNVVDWDLTLRRLACPPTEGLAHDDVADASPLHVQVDSTKRKRKRKMKKHKLKKRRRLQRFERKKLGK